MKIKKINQSIGYIGSIVDSLESTSNQDALSANQGKILNETKANLNTTPQTLSGDRKINSIEVLWDGNWKLGVNANVNGTTQDFTSIIQTNTNIGDISKCSTEEQIVGTWIDGKPIYSRTLIINRIEGQNQQLWNLTNLNIDTFFVNHNRSNYLTQMNYVFPLANNFKNSDDHRVDVLYNKTDKNLYVRTNDTVIIVSGYITIEYTKTTD